jgi:hypothetical protein
MGWTAWWTAAERAAIATREESGAMIDIYIRDVYMPDAWGQLSADLRARILAATDPTLDLGGPQLADLLEEINEELGRCP